jgi:hypothetical protein
MSDHQPHLEPDNVPAAKKSKLDEEAFVRDLKTLSKADLYKKYPDARLNKESEQILEALGGILGEEMHKFDKRFAAMEKAFREQLDAIEQGQQHLDNERSRLMLSVRELRIDLFEELASLKDS